MKRKCRLGVIAAIVLLAISLPVSWLMNFIFSLQTEYTNPGGIFRPWSDPLMSLMFVYPIILGLALACLWTGVSYIMTGKWFVKGIKFGFGYWLIAFVPGMIMTYSSFNISLAMVLSWTISGLINGLIAGLVFAKFDKQE